MIEEIDLVASLQALPETDPVEIEGVQFGPATCNKICKNLSVQVDVSVCIGGTCKS